MSEKKGKNMSMIKCQNRSLILSTIKNRGAVSRGDIAQILQLTPAAISILVNEMIEENIIKEIGPMEEAYKRSGRKKLLIDINYNYGYVIGINIEPNIINIGVSNIIGNIIASKDISTANYREPKKMLKKISSECMNLLWKHNIMKDSVIGVGVGIIGIVDKINGISKQAYGLWKEEVNIKKTLEKQLGINVVVDNNVRALAIGEIDCYNKDNLDNVLFVKYGPGVGSAIIIDNEIYYGGNNSSGEIGHTIIDYNGKLCTCGRRGCLETMVSKHAILEKTRKLFQKETTPKLYEICHGNQDNITLDALCKAAEYGDSEALKILKEALLYISIALANAVSLYDPNKVILYGKTFKYSIVVDELNNILNQWIVDKDLNEYIRISRLDYNSNYIGGIALALREFFYNTGGI